MLFLHGVEGPRGVQTGPLPHSLLRQLPGDERLRGGVRHLRPPAGQRHRRGDDLRLPQAPPERRLPDGHERRLPPRLRGRHGGPPPRRPKPRLHGRQPRLPPALARGRHSGRRPARRRVARNGLRGRRRVRYGHDGGRRG
ncbi:hypothetical protein EYF80_037802 [Liparis tanakae]|uniref:Uncharacterized protein n=1 Tax=Liparis tanakae TaxID=230148 RepID=A0A4Z2GEK5_9TELE|nr:hypothetical protein EYF80_037802 [Liparis tanakae]